MYIDKKADRKTYNRSLPKNRGVPEDLKPVRILSDVVGVEHSAVNFVRNNKGSAWDPLGNNQLIDANQWRFNYNPNTGIYEGLTIMGQWTNEIRDPRDMTTGNWQNLGTGSASRDAVGIDGEPNTAVTITDNDSGGPYGKGSDPFTISDNANTHVGGVFIEKTDSSIKSALEVVLFGGTIVRYTAEIDTQSGNVTALDDASASEVNVEDRGDWWFVWTAIPNNNSGNTSMSLRCFPRHASSSDTGSAVFDAAQVFLNRSSPPPTPVYGETAGQSYTQDPDMADVTNLADINYNPDEATFTVEFNSGYSEGTLFDLYSDSNNRIYAHRNASNEIHFVIVDGGTTQADLNLGTIADNTQGKIAVGWKENDIAGCLDGGTVQTDTTATIPAIDTLHIGRDYNDANYWDAFIGSKLNYPRKLTNNQIQGESQ